MVVSLYEHDVELEHVGGMSDHDFVGPRFLVAEFSDVLFVRRTLGDTGDGFTSVLVVGISGKDSSVSEVASEPVRDFATGFLVRFREALVVDAVAQAVEETGSVTFNSKDCESEISSSSNDFTEPFGFFLEALAEREELAGSPSNVRPRHLFHACL